MALEKSQKKYIKENIYKLTIDEISARINIPKEEIHEYLKDRWGNEKYEKFLSKTNIPTRSDEEKININNFNIIDWLKKNWPFLLFSAILVFVAYFNALHNEFVSDDKAIINEGLGLKLPNFTNMFKTASGFNMDMFFYIARHLGGTNPAYFRIFNIFFHLGNVWGVYLLLYLIGSPVIATLTALLFAVHPILIESVSWVAGAPYSQYGFFLIFSLITYILSTKDKKLYILSVFLFFMAMLSSEKSVFFPLVIFIYELAFNNKKIRWLKIMPFFGISFLNGLKLLGLLEQRAQDLTRLNYSRPSFINPFILVPVAITNYLQLIFWPDGLTLYHSEMYNTVPVFIIRAVFFIIYLVLIFISYKRNRLVFFGLCLFIISLSPTLLPFGLSWIVAERYAYFAALGIFISIAVVMADLLKNKKTEIMVVIFFVLIIISLTVRTIVRNFEWKNEDNLWLATGRTSPSDPKTHNNLGDYYGRHGDWNNAIKEFQIALKLNPRYAEVYHNIGMVYQQVGRQEEARTAYLKSIELNPYLWQSMEKVAVIYFTEKDYVTAEKYMKKAFEINPKSDEIASNLGIIYLSLDNPLEAKVYLQKTLELNPKNQKAKEMLEKIYSIK